jgi:enterochelin esterase-like enzyme
MLEPQSTVLFVLLIFMFGGLIWWLIRTRKVILRVVAAFLAFLVAMQFGVLAVNRYFGYYNTWGAAIADFSNQSTYSGPQLSEGSLLVGNRSLAFNEHNIYLRLAMQQGYTLHLTMPGKLSHISRNVYIYLPPAYFEPQYAHYKFPVIELIHGQPGEPQDWINVAGVQVTLNYMIRHGLAKPVVLVMPDANGSSRVSLQCLNQVRGPQDLTYLALDVPQEISHLLRVQQPGRGWGVAGYSEGGYCAANMALRYRYRYGFAASISGYFVPAKDKLDNPPRLVDPFGGNVLLREENTPVDEVRALAPGAIVPHFWLGAGHASAADVSSAQYFAQELQLHLADVPLDFQPTGGHNMGTWHLLIPPMLAWMTNGLADAVANAKRVAALQAAAARQRKLLAGAAGRSPADHGQSRPSAHPSASPSASQPITASK